MLSVIPLTYPGARQITLALFSFKNNFASKTLETIFLEKSDEVIFASFGDKISYKLNPSVSWLLKCEKHHYLIKIDVLTFGAFFENVGQKISVKTLKHCFVHKLTQFYLPITKPFL